MNRIEELRLQGMGYKKIAAEMGISVNTVKSYCRYHKLTGNRATGDVCLQCGEPIEQNPKYKRRKFCSDRCKSDYWNRHRNAPGRKSLLKLTCVHCGKEFLSYEERRYCSHGCYIQERFYGLRSGDGNREGHVQEAPADEGKV